jgi:hypothetical protein
MSEPWQEAEAGDVVGEGGNNGPELLSLFKDEKGRHLPEMRAEKIVDGEAKGWTLGVYLFWEAILGAQFTIHSFCGPILDLL